MSRITKKVVSNNRGMTLVEIVICLSLISIIALTFYNVFGYAFDNLVKAQEITNYTYATQATIEELRSYDYRTLMDKFHDQSGNEPFDINNDGDDDCFMRFEIEPYGVCDRESNGFEATYIHIIYFDEKALIITGQGDYMYADVDSFLTMTMHVQQNSTECHLIVNGDRMEYHRKSVDAPVVVMVNMELKDFGFNNKLVLTGDTGKVDVKVYGNDIITKEFLSSITPKEYCGIYNISTSLVKIRVALYHEEDDTESFFDMSQIAEIYNGEQDELLP